MASTPSTFGSPASRGEFNNPHGSHTPSSTMAPPPMQVNELDTTMEDADEEEEDVQQQQDDEFAFNAPTYYDLKNPQREQQYVNNADGYFYQQETMMTASTDQQQQQPQQQQEYPQSGLETPRRPLASSTPSRNGHTPQTHQQYPQSALETPRRPPPSSTLSHNGRTPQTPFGMYREPQAEVLDDSDHEMEGEDGNNAVADGDDDRMSDGGRSEDTLVLDATTSLPPPPPLHNQNQLAQSHSSTASAVSASLMQPTKASMNRVQAARDQHQTAMAVDGNSSLSHRVHKPTQPISPHFHTTQRHHNEPKLSSTSRELQKIQEDKMRMQVEAMKIREYHERVRAQRMPANLHQRSTKQLTIPQSPHLAVDQRGTSRRLNTSFNSDEDAAAEEPLRYIPPEKLMSRDFEYPATHGRAAGHNGGGPQEVTVPHTPQLRTSERAARRNVFPEEHSPEQHRPDYAKMRVNGITQAVTPQFETDRRAQQSASYRKPMEVVDKDAAELNRKFHARPVPKKIFDAPRTSPQKAVASKPTLTKPVSPKLATSARARLTSATSMEEEEEQKPLSASNGPWRPTGPTVPETPPLRSLHRHQVYQENMRRRQEAEEDELRNQREFKAQPMRLTATPPKFEGSKKPLTEVMPFTLHSERLHERAQERLERKRQEDEEKARAAAQFRAMPMPHPDEDATMAGAGVAQPPRAPPRQLTKPSSPKFATNRRASERAQYEANERERRARDEEHRRAMEDEKRKQESDEIKRLRRDQLTFHARPVPAPKVFELKPTTRPLTEPESPFLQTKVRGAAAASSSATSSSTKAA